MSKTPKRTDSGSNLETQAVTQKTDSLSPQEKEKRKERVLTQGTPSVTQSIADAVVIKNENIFFLTQPDGSVPLDGQHGFGLYYHDCRYLNGYEFKIANSDPNVLVSDASQGFAAIFELTNPEIQVGEGEHIPMGNVGITWERVLDAGELTLYDSIDFHNYGREQITCPFSLTFGADFKDVFAIRGLWPQQPGEKLSPRWEQNALSLVYEGADGRYRSLTVQFSLPPERKNGTCAEFGINLSPGESKELLVSLTVAEAADQSQVQPQAEDKPDVKGIESYFREASDEWVQGHTKVQSDSVLLNHLMNRSLKDLRTLQTQIEDQDFFAAGVPWFVTLFGRDSAITALQTLSYRPDIAAETLRLLASYQGDEVDEWRDEQPGKILHEIRVGELARLGEIPHTPYYGTVDATPLFLILMVQHAAWTGDLGLFKELRGNVDRALEWIDTYGDQNGDGYVEYKSTSSRGLVNQGWKDSGNAIVNADGSLAEPPIALVEVQGYVYQAKVGLADLYERAGEADRAEQLRQEAKALCQRFNRDFWLDDLGFYALALQKGGNPAAVVSSNPGHALWSGIVDQDKAATTVGRMMEQDMFNGWGVRTLSDRNPAYNPTGYHLGTVWPHDNAIIAAGFRRYGFDNEAQRVFKGITLAAMDFESFRLPELWSGFHQEMYSVPVHYPVACHPQAWAAGSVPFMIETFLGLVPEAFERRLRIVRPILPDFVDQIHVRGLQVADASVDLDFERTSEKDCEVNIARVDGELDVHVEKEQLK